VSGSGSLGSRLALLTAALFACAAGLPVERREYILARPHGWVELSVGDLAIPRVPKSEEEGAEWARPAECRLDVELDGEPFVAGFVYPVGEQPPFAVSSGYRFPAPVGRVRLAVEYAGCDAEGSGSAPALLGEAEIDVAQGQVTDVAFDGERLLPGAPRADTAVTLERIYEALTEPARPAP
jgi:hypothetical protein